MLYFIGTIIGDHTIWEGLRYDDLYLDDGVSISFPLPLQLEAREAINYLKEHLPKDDRDWLNFKNDTWSINLNAFNSKYHREIEGILKSLDPPSNPDPNIIYLSNKIPSKITVDNLIGTLTVSPEVDHKNARKVTQTTIKFVFTYNDIMNAQARKIFLSHKSADKPLVKDFDKTLKTLGFDTWLDEEDLKAGDKVHRGISDGFKNSCAAIFFITHNYVDDKYLATEIDYAISQAYEKGDKFKIITLVLCDSDKKCKVPDLLQQFVYKSPNSHLEAIREIVRALPLKLMHPSF